MRILCFTSSVDLTPETEGALAFVRLAVDSGHSAGLAGLILSFGQPRPTPLGLAADEADVPFRILQQRFRLDPGPLGQLDTLLARSRTEVYVSWGFRGLYFARVASRRRTPWVAALPPGEPEAGGRGLLGRLKLRELRRASGVIVESEGTRATLEASGVKVRSTAMAAAPGVGLPESALRLVQEVRVGS